MRLRNIALMSTLCASTLTGAAFAQSAASDPTGCPSADPTCVPAAGNAGDAGDAGEAGGVSVFPLQPGDGVSIDQVVFDTADGAQTSAWGRVEVDPVAIREALGEPEGFVNVRVGGEWVALNIPVDLDPGDTFPRAVAGIRIADDGGALPVVTYFDLGSTKSRRAVSATVVFSTEPLMQAADYHNLGSLPASKFRVSKVQQTLSNGIDDLAAPGPGPLPPPPQNPSIQMPAPLEGYWVVNLPNPVNVQAAHNQCVPVAAANALLYMRETFSFSHGFQAPHSAGRGWRESGSHSLAEELDERMLRPVVGQCQGSGTGYCPDWNGDSSLYAGVANYLADFNDPDDLLLRVQGSQNSFCFGGMAVDAVQDAQEVTFDWLCDRIQDGAGVTLTYNRYDQDDEQGNEVYTGAHAIRVFGCGVSGGRTFIRVLNDTRQDRNVDDVCTERDGLESQLVFVEDLDNDGRLNYGDNTRREIVQAMAIMLDP